MVTKTTKKVSRKKATKKKVTKKKPATIKNARGEDIAAPKKKLGRPTKYEPKFCEILIDKMSEGYSKEAVAGYIGISKNTLYEWAQAHEDFADAIAIGESQSRLHWEGKLVDYAVHTKNGKQINGQVFNLNMKNRFGWRDKTEVDVGNKDGEEFKFNFDLSKKPSHRE